LLYNLQPIVKVLNVKSTVCLVLHSSNYVLYFHFIYESTVYAFTCVAIKTGRYTHKKRTLDTLEIKHVTPGSLPSSVAEPNIPDHHSPSVSTGESEEKLASLANEICQAYRKSFVDATYLNEHAEEINEIVKQMLSDRGMSEVTGVLYSPGHTPSNDEDHQQLAEFVAVVSVHY